MVSNGYGRSQWQDPTDPAGDMSDPGLDLDDPMADLDVDDSVGDDAKVGPKTNH